MSRRFIAAGLFLLALLAGVHSATLYVSVGGTSTTCTSETSACGNLATALAAATSGSEIRLGAGTHSYTGNVNQVIPTGWTITITGSGQGVTIIDAGKQGRFFYVDNAILKVQHLSMKNAYLNVASDTLGGCFFANEATITLDHIDAADCIIYTVPGSTGWTALGGVMYAGDSVINIMDSYFNGARASAAGSFYFAGASNVTLNNITIFDSRCVASGCIGGAMVPEGNTHMTVSNSLFSTCVAPDGFGGAIDDGTSAVWNVYNTTFYNNRATYGGAVYNFGSTISYFKNVSFIDNIADNNGGAVKPSSNTVATFEDCLFSGNQASSNAAVGPASECTGSTYCTVFRRCRFYKNYASSIAGALALVASTVLEDVVFDSNYCADTAGALYMYLDVATSLSNLTFINNTAPNGAAIYIEGSTIFDFEGTTTFVNNTARYLSLSEPTGIGGGFAIVRSAGVNFNGPVVFLNNAAGTGGGAYIGGSSVVSFEDDVSFTGSKAGTNGAAIWLGSAATLNFTTNVTFTQNNAVSYGGAIYQDAQSHLNSKGLFFLSNTASYGAGYASSSTSVNCPSLTGSAFVNNTATLLGGGLYIGSSAISCANGEACPGCYMSGNVAPFGADETSAPSSVNATAVLPTSLSASEGFAASFKLYDAAGRQAASTDRVIAVSITNFTLPTSSSSTAKSTSTQVSGAKRDILATPPTATPSTDSVILRGPSAAYFVDNVASFSALKLSGPPGSVATIEFDASPSVPNPVTVTIAITPCQSGYISYESAGTYYCLKAIRTSKATQIAITTVAACCIVIGLVTLVWLIVNRNRTAIRKSSTVFCILTTIGATIMFVAAIMWVYVTDATCALRVWLLILGFVLCYGSIFVKEYRLWLIFDETDLMRTVRVTDSLLLKVVFGGLFIELLIAMIWFIITPFLKRVVIDLNAEEIAYRCTSTVTPAFFWILFALNMGILIIGCILAFLARNVPANFNEAKQILFSIYNVTLVSIIVVVLSLVFRDSPEATGLTVSIGLLFSSLITIGILFVPKVRHVANKESVRRAILKEIAQLERDIQWKKRMLNDVNTETSGSHTTKNSGRSVDSNTAR